MTFRDVLGTALRWRELLEGPGPYAPRVVLFTAQGKVVEYGAAEFTLVVKALVAAATRGCRAMQGVERKRPPYATMILDDYAAEREAAEAVAAGLPPDQAGVRSVGALEHRSVLEGPAAQAVRAADVKAFLTRPAERPLPYPSSKARP